MTHIRTYVGDFRAIVAAFPSTLRERGVFPLHERLGKPKREDTPLTQGARIARMLSTLFLLTAGVATAAGPNILLIYVDDLGYGDLASFGHPVIRTPNLDKLAQEGLTLTNYYAPSALCSPSRAGLLTGRYPYRTGIKSWIPADSGVYLRSEEITLAELLKTNGYSTALVGKWHLNSDLVYRFTNTYPL